MYGNLNDFGRNSISKNILLLVVMVIVMMMVVVVRVKGGYGGYSFEGEESK